MTARLRNLWWLVWSVTVVMWVRAFLPWRRQFVPTRRFPTLPGRSKQWINHKKQGLLASFATTSQYEQPASIQDFVKQGNETTVTYLTDVEGDKAYLDRYVKTSRVLTWRNVSSSSSLPQQNFPYDQCIEFVHDRAVLVFGGDIWDKGGHDLYTIRQMNDLKRRYPDRVVFILGNRDVNKLRILQEIGLQEPPPPHPGLGWFQGTGRMGDPDSNPPPESSVDRLKWMLSQTMGSPDAFDHRKNELVWESTMSPRGRGSVTDQDVVESYRRSCHPRGELGEFLSGAQLICKLGPLVFVHGSLPLIEEYVTKKYQSGQSVWDDLTSFMPWLPNGETAQDHGVTTIHEWMDALNGFCRRKVLEWKADIARIEARGGIDDCENPIWACNAGYQNSYSDLIQYGMGMLPNRKKNPTVVYNSFTPGGMPHHFDSLHSDETHMMQATKEFFDRSAVQVILAGHKPQGDLPSAIRVDKSKWVVLADTSYSSQTVWHHDNTDNRGALYEERSNLGRGSATSFRGEVAVSEVLIKLGEGGIMESLTYHGVLSDGTEYETVNLITNAQNTTIGQAAPEHLVPSETESPHQGRWWTKTIFSDGSHLFYAGQGFNIWNLMAKPVNSKPT